MKLISEYTVWKSRWSRYRRRWECLSQKIGSNHRHSPTYNMCYPNGPYDLTLSNSLTAVRDVDDASKTFVRGNRIANAIGVVACRAGMSPWVAAGCGPVEGVCRNKLPTAWKFPNRASRRFLNRLLAWDPTKRRGESRANHNFSGTAIRLFRMKLISSFANLETLLSLHGCLAPWPAGHT